MPTLAIAKLRNVNMGPEIAEYLERIDATLTPFEGKFVVHGGRYERLEGDWDGDLIAIEFPDRAHARAWYDSPAYREILPLRTRNSDGEVVLIDTVDAEHRATDVLR